MSPKFLCALCALIFPVAAVAAPANSVSEQPVIRKPAKRVVSVDAQARSIFARAAALYKNASDGGKLRALRANWKTLARSNGEPDSNISASLEFEAKGRMRLFTPDDYQELTVCDGQRLWAQAHFLDEKKRAQVWFEDLDPETAYLASLSRMQFSTEVVKTFYNLLLGANPLDAGEIESEMSTWVLAEVRAVVLPAQPLDGEACDLVRINRISPNDPASGGGVTTQQLTHWFARSDGRLMRLQTRTTLGTKVQDSSDSTLTLQQFDPTFDPKTFQFVVPAKAVVEERK